MVRTDCVCHIRYDSRDQYPSHQWYEVGYKPYLTIRHEAGTRSDLALQDLIAVYYGKLTKELVPAGHRWRELLDHGLT